MDRVVCCYPDMEALVDAAASRRNTISGWFIREMYGWMKLGIRVINSYLRLRGDAFRSFIHPTAAVEQVAAENGCGGSFIITDLFGRWWFSLDKRLRLETEFLSEKLGF